MREGARGGDMNKKGSIEIPYSSITFIDNFIFIFH
jgi:hypothetical protein